MTTPRLPGSPLHLTTAEKKRLVDAVLGPGRFPPPAPLTLVAPPAPTPSALRRALEAVRRLARAVCQAFARLAAAFRRTVPPAVDRPAWASPHGPAPTRRPRT